MKHLLFFLHFVYYSFSQNSSVLTKKDYPEETKNLKQYFNSFNSKINSDVFTSPPIFLLEQWQSGKKYKR